MIHYWFEEYRAIARNQGALILLFGAIVLYSFFYPIPYQENVLREVPVAVVDLDYTQLSRQFTRMLDANEFVRVVSKPPSLEAAKQEFFEGKVYGVLVIPEQFQRKIRRGETTYLSAYYDTTALLFYKQVKTGVSYVARTMSAGIQIRKFEAAGFRRERAMKAQDPLPFIGIPLFNPAGGYGDYVIPAVFILIVQQTLLLGIGMVGGARREAVTNGAVPRPRLRDIPPLVCGRTAAYLTIGLITSLYLLAMIRFYYRFPLRAQPVELLLVAIPFLLSTTLLAITLSSFFRSREVAVLVLIFTSLPCLFLVGFAWPIEAIPRWLHLASYAIPSTAGVDAFIKLNQMGARLVDLPFNFYFLWALTGVYFVTACAVSRKIPPDPD